MIWNSVHDHGGGLHGCRVPFITHPSVDDIQYANTLSLGLHADQRVETVLNNSLKDWNEPWPPVISDGIQKQH